MSNDRNAGRKPHGKKAKVGKSIKMDEELIQEIEKEFGSNFSGGVEHIVRLYFSKRKRKAA